MTESNKSIFFRYFPNDPPKKMLGIIAVFEIIAIQFGTYYGFNLCFNNSILIEVIKLANRDVTKLNHCDNIHPNEFRQGSILAVWIARLKPIVKVSYRNKDEVSEEEKETIDVLINEFFAIFVALTLIDRNNDDIIGIDDLKREMTSSQWRNLVNILHNKIISRHAIELILQLIVKHSLV